MTRQAQSRTWYEHALRRSRWQPQRQIIALASLGFFIALILGALYLSQVASEATMNRQLSDLLAERDDLERTNEGLRAEIARKKAVPELLARAEALGFTVARPEQIEYLPIRGYVPHQPDTVAPIEETQEDVEVYDETFTGWLEEQWDNFRESLGG